MSRTGSALVLLARGFRRLSAAAWSTGVLGGTALVLGAAAWGARLGWFSQPYWVLGTWVVVAVLGGGAVVLAVRRLRRLSARWLATELEATGFRRGSLSGHLEASAPGTSPALLDYADGLEAARLVAEAPGYISELRGPFRRQAYQGSVTLVAGAAVLLSAQPSHGRPALLWRPTEAWEATVAPLSITVSAREVERGARVDVAVLARGRQHAILWMRAPGESWRGQGLTLDSVGRATTSLGPLETDLFVRVQSGGRNSDTLLVKVRIPAFLGMLTVTARYPRYLRLEDEPVPTHGDTVAVPEGTRLDAEGEATGVLARAAWQSGATRAQLQVEGPRFGGSFTPAGIRTWTLVLEPSSGYPLAGDTVRIPVLVVPDSAPRIEVPVPGADTVVPLSLRVPLVIDAQDDHGLTGIVVESRRISRLGLEDAPRAERVALPGTARDRAILSFELDLNQRGLLPGDTVRFFVRATDNAPLAHVSRSKEFALRLPTLSEVREAARVASAQVSRGLDSVAQASRRLERQTEDLSRERARAATDSGAGGDESLRFADAKRAETVAASQQELLRQTEALKEALDALRRSAEAAGLHDPEWQERLREIQSELDRALTPELKERLAELQRALQNLDPERAKEALERLAEAQQQLREALERSSELFKRAALEGDLANLAAEARDLTAQQQQWAQGVAAQDSARAAQEERALSARTDSLGAALERVTADAARQAPDRQAAMSQSAQRAQQAAAQMRQAAVSADQGKRPQARRQGEAAAEQLEGLGQELQQQRADMQQEWRQEILRALDQALGDASRLAERQLGVAQRLTQGDASAESRAEQGAIEEGVARLLEQVKEIGGKNALVSQQSSVALAAGRDDLRRSREALSTAAPNLREAAARSAEAVDALNAAAFTLLRSRGAVDGSSSGSGLQEAMEQMAQMAQQQGQLGQQAGGLLPQLGQGGAALQEQLRALGARQRALAERLERMRAGGQIPGAADLAQEAKDLARAMEAGRLDRQTVERQERLFRRMLDAGRTLQGEEKDENKERQSTTAKDDSIHLPPALRAQLRGGDQFLRIPTWEELQQLSPDERRRVVEYFRRLSEGAGGPR